MLCLWSGPPGFNFLIYFTLVFSCINCSVLIFVYLFLYLDLNLLRDDTSISKGYFIRTKPPCGHLLGKGHPLVSFVFLSLSHVVSWVRCDT